MTTIRAGSSDLVHAGGKALLVGVTEGATELPAAIARLDQPLDGAIASLQRGGAITGKAGELTTLHTLGKLPAARVVVLGLGKPESLSVDKLRGLIGDAARSLRRGGVDDLAIALPGGADTEQDAQAVTEGALLGLYTFRKHKSKADDGKELHTVTIIVPDASDAEALQRGVARGDIIARSVMMARDMSNEPSNHMTPTELAARARAAADDAGIECTVLDREEMVELGMGGLLGVAQGSHQPPKFIVLTYRGDPSTDHAIGFVGKGITFDTGGISIKPAQGMEAMKGDMSGGAAVIAALHALGKLGPRVNVTGIVPATENMPGGGAIKPGDVLRAMNGKTMEVVNTDAEGRLILSDGLSYARNLGLSPIIDIATLTGAISIALGDVAVGVMSTDDELVGQIKQAAAATGEKFWQLPMYEEYKDLIRSDVADVKNSGGRLAGSITAAWFLEEFAQGAPWAHLDIAGVDNYERDKGVIVKGFSGIPVRTLVEFALQQAERQQAGAPK